MRMIQHEPLDNAPAEGDSLRISDRDPRTLSRRRHAGHDDLSVMIVLILKLFHGTLSAGANRSKRRMPAEVRQLETVRKASVKQVLIRVHVARFVVHVNGRHT